MDEEEEDIPPLFNVEEGEEEEDFEQDEEIDETRNNEHFRWCKH